MGKRNERPISRRAYAALEAHWTDRDVLGGLAGPLLAPVGTGTSPRARAKAAQGQTGYSDRGLRHLVDRAGTQFRGWLAEHHAELARRPLCLHPHAYRHAFGTAATEAQAAGDVVQSSLGQASPATTALYHQAGARKLASCLLRVANKTKSTGHAAWAL